MYHSHFDMRMKKQLLMLAGSLFVAGNLFAVPLNLVNITIADGQSAAGYTGTGIGLEDNETEPGTLHGDVWDLEAFGYDAASHRLDVIGTYDFKNGVQGTTAGAVFVRAGSTIPGATGWTFAYVLNFANYSYNLYDSFSIVTPTDIAASSPVTINTATAHLLGSGTFGYVTNLTNPDGFNLATDSSTYANKHNEIQLDLSALGTNVLNGFVVHTTLSCGNDELEGRYAAVPDNGLTVLLLGLGLISLALARKTFCST
jgi:hypothetical protein